MSIDFISVLLNAHGYDAIMNVVDFRTKQAHFMATHTIISADGAARLFLNHVWNGHQVKFAVGFMPRRFRATAQIASLRVQTDFPAKAGPPVAPQNQFEGFESPRMPCDARVVVLLNDSLSKILIFWDIDLATEEEEMIFEGPFRTSN